MRTRKEQLSALRRDNHVRGAAGKKGSKSGPRSDPKSQPSARFGGLYTVLEPGFPVLPGHLHPVSTPTLQADTLLSCSGVVFA